MNSDSIDNQGPTGTSMAMAAAVILGIVLFVTGFAMTLFFLSDPAAAGTQGQEPIDSSLSSASGSAEDDSILIIGLLLSMVGVIIATVAPAVAFIRRAKLNA